MGCTGTKTINVNESKVIKEINLEEPKAQTNNNQTNIKHHIHFRRNESIIDHKKPFTELEPDISKRLLKEICRINIETREGLIIKGTGLILAFPIDLEFFYCLMTNDHVINNDSINENQIIYITYEEFKSANIKLDKNKRYIKSFIDKKLDITVVEILDEDNISKKYYLFPELDIPVNDNLINSEIYIPQYIEEKKLKNAEGTIKDIITNYEFSHLANTQPGSSGSPIFLKNNNKVIGIHKSGIKNEENFGDFIYPVINMIKEDIRKKNNNGKYLDDKYIYNDGKYFIGETKNNVPNGKGIKYYKNGNIFYKGDFINGKPEGNGKVIYEDGVYYIGQFKNGLRSGKGILYYHNGNIMYDGDWVDNKPEGDGKDIYENGCYYIGQFKNGLRNGKGTLYYSNGNIKYEGDWVNNKSEGNGKDIYVNNYYYIGQFKNGLRNGKGTYYYSKGNIMYEGDWVKGKPEGKGKAIYENGFYYIGEFKKGLRNGKGTYYYLDGNKMYEGDWVDNKPEGNGKDVYEDGYYYEGQFKNGLRNGKGKYYYPYGYIMYEGDWVNNKPEGNGKVIYQDGIYYI